MFLACVIYPAGWDAPEVVSVCNSSAYDSNRCYILWAYILAIVAIFDAIVLAILAFVLAYKRVKLLPWQGECNEAVSEVTGILNCYCELYDCSCDQGWQGLCGGRR